MQSQHTSGIDSPAHETPRLPVDVILTFDTEFSLNSAFMRLDRRPIGLQWVYARDDAGRSHGLGFVLETLHRYALHATFFIECFNVFHFGDAPMSAIVEDISHHGHDPQLHLHPTWLYFRDSAGSAHLSDEFAGLGPALLSELVTDSVAIFERLTGRRPLAFRAGNLDLDYNLYPALANAGIELSSNIGVGYCQPPDEALRLFSGIHELEGVVEVPVTTYADFFSRRSRRILTIAGSSIAELRCVLHRAHHAQIGPIVVLAHPHDFATINRDEGADGHQAYPAPLQKRRLNALCRYLAENPDRFRVTTFAEAAPRWTESRRDGNALVQACFSGFASRLVENKLQPLMRRLVPRRPGR